MLPAMNETLTRRALEWLIRVRWGLLALALILGAVGTYVGSGLTMDRSLERMFAPDDPLLPAYQKLQKAFGKHQIVLAIYRDEQLDEAEGLARVNELAQRARSIPGVVSVVSMHDVPGLVGNGGTEINDNKRAELLVDVFAGYTHNAELDAAGVVCLLDQSSSAAVPTRETLAELHKLVDDLPGGALVGEPVMIGEAFDLLEADGRRLNTWCLGLLLATFFVCFRQIRWIVLPLMLVQITLAMTRGLLVLFNLQLSMVSSMLAAIVTVVGIAAIVHVIVRYRDERSSGHTPQEAFIRAGEVIVAPLFFACLTDALGFAALMVSNVKPVVDFGLMMALGSALVFVVIAMITPAIVLFGNDRLDEANSEESPRLQLWLHSLYEWSSRRAKTLGLIAVLITVVTVIGSMRLEQETDFTRNFREDSQLVTGYQFVDRDFGGAGVWDILIPAPAKIDKDFVIEITNFEQELQEKAPGLTKAMSLADMLDAGSGGLENVSFGADMALQMGLRLVRGRLPDFIGTIHNATAPDEERYVRIMLRAPEQLEATAKARLIDQVQSVTAETYPDAHVTGYYVLLTNLIESLLRDQWTTFAVSSLGVLLVMVVAFRSFPLALVTLIPNILPVFWLFGVMGWLGLKINMGAAMIAAVSVGLSVDGSIHYVMSYQRLRRLGLSIDESLQAVQGSVGRSAVLATLALMVGFSTLMVSEFVPTVYFGSLVTLTMIGGLVGNIVALPLLIKVVEKEKIESASVPLGHGGCR
jgi:predicted RND superfamily exporter protein